MFTHELGDAVTLIIVSLGLTWHFTSVRTFLGIIGIVVRASRSGSKWIKKICEFVA
jgi:hypothetical protein